MVSTLMENMRLLGEIGGGGGSGGIFMGSIVTTASRTLRRREREDVCFGYTVSELQYSL
jgi:hypothetical protein